jgi:hypothetical protein
VPKIRITRTMVVTKEVEFDKVNYVGATDYKGDPYPEITDVYQAAAWERQEELDPDVAHERAIDNAADAAGDEDFYLNSTFEVIED